MRGILGIAIGVAFVALALDFIRVEESMPLLLRWFVCIMGAIMALVGILHLRFRLRQTIALSGGRERRGTLRLRKELGEHSATGFLIFATSYAEWLLMLDPELVKDRQIALRDGVKASAIMGENERIYAITLDGKQITLQNEGIPFEGNMRERIESAEKSFANLTKRQEDPTS